MSEAIPSEPVILDQYEVSEKLLGIRHAHRDQWRRVQAIKLYNATWKAPPWAIALHELEQGLFPHLSSDRDGMIAYTPSPAYGEKDRIVRTKPGRYLAKYRPDMSQKEREAICAKMGATVLIKSDVLFARTEDEIEEVYNSGPKSCMTDDDFTYEHPTHVYASPDMGVAYIYDTKGQVVARAVVSVKDKRFGRIYPSPQNWEQNTELYMSYSDAAECQTTLERGLQALGYECGSFNGNRINKIHVEGSVYVMPYIDGGYGIELSDCKQYFLLNNEKASCGNTCGTYDFQSDVKCANCPRYVEDEDDLYTVRCSSGRRGWCENCHDEHTFTCAIDGEVYSSYSYCDTDVEGLGNCLSTNAETSDAVRYCSGSLQYFHEATIPYKEIDGNYYRDEWLADQSREFYQDEETGGYHWKPVPPAPRPAPIPERQGRVNRSMVQVDLEAYRFTGVVTGRLTGTTTGWSST